MSLCLFSVCCLSVECLSVFVYVGLSVSLYCLFLSVVCFSVLVCCLHVMVSTGLLVICEFNLLLNSIVCACSTFIYFKPLVGRLSKINNYPLEEESLKPMARVDK